MNEFQKQYEEVLDLLRFGDYSLVVKRIIDFTLDTESLEFYKKGNALLDWLDANDGSEEKPARLKSLLEELHGFLSTKPLAPREVILEAMGVTKR